MLNILRTFCKQNVPKCKQKVLHFTVQNADTDEILISLNLIYSIL